MALAKDLVQVNFTPLQADFLGDTQADGIAATGTTIGTAKQLTASINQVSTATAGVNACVKLPLIASYKQSLCVVRNGSLATVTVFPYDTDRIGYAGAGTGANLVSGATGIFFKASSNIWAYIIA